MALAKTDLNINTPGAERSLGREQPVDVQLHPGIRPRKHG